MDQPAANAVGRVVVALLEVDLRVSKSDVGVCCWGERVAGGEEGLLAGAPHRHVRCHT